jgi:hypothetical protein
MPPKVSAAWYKLLLQLAPDKQRAAADQQPDDVDAARAPHRKAARSQAAFIMAVVLQKDGSMQTARSLAHDSACDAATS